MVLLEVFERRPLIIEATYDVISLTCDLIPARVLSQGVNYVFDKRMGDKVTSDTLSSCHQCGQPCAEHTNCANPCCHARLIQCER